MRARLLPVVAAALAIGCATPEPLTPQKRSVRVTAFDDEHHAWLYEHCYLVGAGSGVQSVSGALGLARMSGGNVVEVLSMGEQTESVDKDGKTSSSVTGLLLDVVVFGCPALPPWPRTDGDLQRAFAEEGAVNTCNNTVLFDKDTFQVSRQGSGAKLSNDKPYARVRLKTTAWKLSKEERLYGDRLIFEGDPNWERATVLPAGDHVGNGPKVEHVLHSECFEPCIRKALLELQEGGVAEAQCKTFVISGPAVHEVELVEVGGEALFLKHLGLQ